MSARGIDFLEIWIDQNVPSKGEMNRGRTVESLVKQLTADAAAQDISFDDMGLDSYSPEKYIAQAMTYTREQIF